jgi:hypothetical protein
MRKTNVAVSRQHGGPAARRTPCRRVHPADFRLGGWLPGVHPRGRGITFRGKTLPRRIGRFQNLPRRIPCPSQADEWLASCRVGHLALLVAGLYDLIGETKKSLPFLLSIRPGLTGEDRFLTDQALVVAYLRMGQKVEALAVVDEGVARGGQFAAAYLRLRAAAGP